MIRRLRPGEAHLHAELARRFGLRTSSKMLADASTIVCVATTDNGDDVGLAVATIGEDGTAELVELVVAAACRSDGYERALEDEIARIARAPRT